MTRSNGPEETPEKERSNQSSDQRQTRSSLRSRAAFTVVGAALVVVTGGALWAWVWIHRSLAPLIQTNLEQVLQRPVNVGELEQVTLTGLRFGPSEVPATPTDPDRFGAKAIDVTFSIPRLIFDRTLELNIALEQPNVYIEQAADGEWISTRLNLPEQDPGPIKTELQSVSLEDAQLTLLPTPRPNAPTGAVALNDVNGVIRIFDNNQRFQFSLAGLPGSGGSIKLEGELEPQQQQTDLKITAENIATSDFSRLVELPVTFWAGKVSGNLSLEYNPDQDTQFNGTVSLDRLKVQVPEVPQMISDVTGDLKLQGQTVATDRIDAQYGNIPLQAQGSINTETGYNLKVNVPATPFSTLLETFKVEVPIPLDGVLKAEGTVQGAIERPVVAGTVASIGPAQIDRVVFQSMSGQFEVVVAENASKVTLSNLLATPQSGGQISGSGTVGFGDGEPVNLTLVAQKVSGDALAQTYGAPTNANFQIGNVGAIARITGTPADLRTVVNVNAPQATFPTRGTVVVAGDRVLLEQGTVQVNGGTLEASGQFVNGQYQAVVNANQVPLSPFSPQLRGQLNGAVRLAGNTTSPGLAGLQATGQMQLTEGVSVINGPIDADLQWNGRELVVQQASAPGLSARGTVAVQTAGTPQIGQINLAVQADNYNLRDLSPLLPNTIALGGAVNFDGRVTGTPATLRAAGDLQLQDFRVNDLAFDPVLTGAVDAQVNGTTRLRLDGEQDRIALAVNPSNRQGQFLLRRGEAIAQGKTEGDTLRVSMQSIPIGIAQSFLPEAASDFGPLAGDLTGTLAVNLRTTATVGDVAIAKLRVGRLNADAVRGDFRFADGALLLNDGVWQQGASRIAFGGQFSTRSDGPVQAQIKFDQARVQDILTSLSVFDFADLTPSLRPPELGEIADLEVDSVDISDQSLFVQLQVIAALDAWLAEQRANRAAEPIPPLSELQGELTGAIAINGNLQDGLKTEFKAEGQNWIWRNYKIENVVAEGSVEDGELTLLPAQVTLQGGTIAFGGTIGSSINGQIRVIDLPTDVINPFVPPLPIQVAGLLDATVTLSGELLNPSAVGEISLVDGKLNQQPVQESIARFSYSDARLKFINNTLLSGEEPIRITGSVPVELPITASRITDNTIQIDVRAQDDALALVNVFTDQVIWKDGEGDLNVEVRGTFAQPVVQGKLVVDDATVALKAAPEPLTAVKGTVNFSGDRLTVETFTALYDGNPITSSGILPIFNEPDAIAAAQADPLMVNLEDLFLDLPVYEGRLVGTVVVQGTVLTPRIAGNLDLNNGQVFLVAPEGVSPNGGTSGGTTAPGQVAGPPIALDNLKVVLGNNLRIVQQPIMNFVSTGEITIGGTVDRPRPSGQVRLVRGQLNLFTTQFLLARGFEQTATFTPSQGLDPTLDLRLVALVPEITGSLVVTKPQANEIAISLEDSSGRLNTVRVTATLNGSASQINNNLVLTSEPRRTEAEIIGLLGGSYVGLLGQGDPLFGITAIASSALFGRFQGAITQLGQVIGLSELRIFPAIVPSAATDVPELGLAVEGIVDIGSNLSVSASRVFGVDDPFRFGLLYRVSDQLRVRGSTDLDLDTRIQIEFESRF